MKEKSRFYVITVVVTEMNDIFDCKLLIVDDEPELCRMVREILRREGFMKIIIAANCKEARQLFAHEKPDGVILDVSLPDGDGFSLLREFRAASAVPVLFLLRATRMKIVFSVWDLAQMTILRNRFYPAN